MNTREHHNSWRSLRPFFLACILFWCVVWLLIDTAYGAEYQCAWDADCISFAPTTKDANGAPIEAQKLSYMIETAKSATGPWQFITTIKAAPTTSSPFVRSPVTGTNYYRVVATLDGDVGTAASAAASSTTGAPSPNPDPVPKPLTTVGGEVFAASPNWSNFSWKLGAKAGTVAKGIKCDTTRRIGVDYYRVTSAIVWTGAKKDYVVARCA